LHDLGLPMMILFEAPRDEAKGDPFILKMAVTCDGQHLVKRPQVVVHSGTYVKARETLEKNGWRWHHGHHFCPACQGTWMLLVRDAARKDMRL
jgi:hypothetical protein